jgi:hypothetical protein
MMDSVLIAMFGVMFANMAIDRRKQSSEVDTPTEDQVTQAETKYYCIRGDHNVESVVWLEQLEMGCKPCMLKLRETLTKDRDVHMRLWRMTDDGLMVQVQPDGPDLPKEAAVPTTTAQKITTFRGDTLVSFPPTAYQEVSHWECTVCHRKSEDGTNGSYNTVAGWRCAACHPLRPMGARAESVAAESASANAWSQRSDDVVAARAVRADKIESRSPFLDRLGVILAHDPLQHYLQGAINAEVDAKDFTRYQMPGPVSINGSRFEAGVEATENRVRTAYQRATSPIQANELPTQGFLATCAQCGLLDTENPVMGWDRQPPGYRCSVCLSGRTPDEAKREYRNWRVEHLTDLPRNPEQRETYYVIDEEIVVTYLGDSWVRVAVPKRDLPLFK